jgi:hypothetical protein
MPSQFGQDEFVLDVLDGMRAGFFLDSGASDGVQSSNTYLLEATFGWNGICVEPNDAFYAALVRNRRCQCLHCCLYDRDGTVDFLEAAGTLGGIVDDYDPAHLKYTTDALRRTGALSEPLSLVSKPARTVRSVLRDCAAPSVLDYWSLDTEGSEVSILKSFPFDEYSFRVLTVEHNWLPARAEIQSLLEARGYRRIKTLEIDDCYILRELGSMGHWRSRAWIRSRPRPAP